MTKTPIAIIGCGPAGSACAVQLKRSGFDPIVYESREAGGTIRAAHFVENYPGFPGGVSGNRLASLICDALENWDVTLVLERVKSLIPVGDLFRVSTADSTGDYRCVIVSTGTRPTKLNGIPVDNKVQKNIIYNVMAVKEAAHVRVGILGGGDVAMDNALHLADTSEVHVFHRSTEPGALPLLCERARDAGVTLHETGSLESVKSAGDKMELVFEKGRFVVEALLPSIGREPVTEFVAPEILARRACLREERRLYIIGDVASGPYRQVAIAAGEGLKAAMEVHERWS
jgi:thioredoxin reductase (NADPH)